MALVPGNPGGSAGAASYLMRHPHLFKGLYQAPALTGLGWAVTQFDKIQAKEAGLSLQEYRNALADKTWTGITIPLSNFLMGVTPSSLVDGSSSQGLVQNGGPSAPPPLVQSGQLSDILSFGKISRPQSAHGRSSRTSAIRRRRKVVNPRKGERCPPGYYWHAGKRACIFNVHSPYWKR